MLPQCPAQLCFFQCYLLLLLYFGQINDDDDDDDNDDVAYEMAMFVLCCQGVDKGCRYKHGLRQTVRSYWPQWHRKNHASPNTGKVC